MDSSRRQFLKVSALGSAVGLAGCTGSGISYPEDSTDLTGNSEVATATNQQYNEEVVPEESKSKDKTSYK
ncbi:twin-arginine translocation signal domain-containing protein [Halospeciosus flavus]|uniref:Twin-arginine translocation signal domain-containing protein n=2 Tax=Halospeciosus flavus TaxID=3032283 RepID=A0ABD5Z6L5_9EURY